MQQNLPKEWLVKSGGHIRGPYTYDEVADLITSKDVILVDEIARSFGRWKLIRDEGVFEKVVLEVQNRYESSGEKTFTQTETDAISDEINQGLLNFARKDNLFPNEVEKKKEEPIAIPHELLDSKSSKTYGINKELSFFEKIYHNKPLIKFLALSAMILIVIVILLNRKDDHRQKTFEDYKLAAVDFMNQGDLENATLAIKSALSIREENELIFMLGTLELMAGDTVLALKNFDQLKTRTKNPQTLSQIYNLLGVINLKNYNLSAARLEFEAALEQDPRFVQAYYNKGVVDYFENKFESAFNNFSQAMVYGGLDGTILLSMTEILTKGKTSYTNEDKQRLSYYLSLIGKHIQTFEVFKQELFIASALLQNELGQTNESLKSISLALDVDPELTDQHLLDISLYRGLVSWDVISEWVQRIQRSNADQVKIKALQSYAFFRGTEKFKGKELAESLLRPDFSNVEAQIIYGYILYSLGQKSEAEAALLPVKEVTQLTLGNYLLSKICFDRNDLDCTKSYVDKVVQSNPNHISGLNLISNYYIKKKSREKAMEFAQKAYKLSSYSKEVLKTKKMAEAL